MSEFPEPVFTVLGPLDYVRRMDGRSFLLSEFFKDPADLSRPFCPLHKRLMSICPDITGRGESGLLHRRASQCRGVQPAADRRHQLRLQVRYQVPFVLPPLPSFLWLQASSANEVAFGSPDPLACRGQFPGELPRDASEDFGDDLLAHVLPQFFNADPGTVLQRATETDSGQLTPSFHYLQDYVDDAD